MPPKKWETKYLPPYFQRNERDYEGRLERDSWQKKVDAKDQKTKVQVADDAWAVDAVVQPGSFLPNPRLLVEPALIIGPKLTFA